MEMPLPTPRSVICSPSHIRNSVPVVIVMVAVKSHVKPVVIVVRTGRGEGNVSAQIRFQAAKSSARSR